MIFSLQLHDALKFLKKTIMENKPTSLQPNGSKKILISEEQNGMLIWLGSNDNVSKTAGQVFYNAQKARIDNLAVLPHAASQNCKLRLEMYRFDPLKKEWLEKLYETTEAITTADCEEWLFFKMGNHQLESDAWYGFKLICSNGQVALAEGLHQASEAKSMEWTALKASDKGVFHDDFHLAYMVELAA
jgi:hypothetical protein